MTSVEPIGLRERKRERTKRHILDVALRLFASDGYDETTIEAIAGAADISQRTFFHYFASKEDILASWQAGMPDLLHAAIDAQPDRGTPLQTLREAISQMPQSLDRKQALAMNRIFRRNEQLRASNNAKMLRLEEVAFDALRARYGNGFDLEPLRVAAMVAVGAVRLGLDAWSSGNGQAPVTLHIGQAFDALTTVLPRSELPPSAAHDGINLEEEKI